MKNWQEKYKDKICSPDEAIQKIKNVKRISFGHICSESSVLTEALVRNKKLFKKLEIDHLLSVGKSEYAKKENSEYFHHNALFIGSKTREAAKKVVDEVETLYTNGPSGGGGVSKAIEEVVSICSIFIPRDDIQIKVIYEEV